MKALLVIMLTLAISVFNSNGFAQNWQTIPGSLKYVSAVDSSTAWGVNENDSVYRTNNGGATWQQVPGALAQVSALSYESAWGVNSDGAIWRTENGGVKWWPRPGRLKHISAVSYEIAWGTNADDNIYATDSGGARWDQVPGALKQVTALSYKSAWGVNSSNTIWRTKNFGADWEQVPGSLKHVSVVSDKVAWGVNAADYIYRTKNAGSTWQQVSGGLKQISALDYDSAWGVNSNNNIYYTGALDLFPGMGGPDVAQAPSGPRCPDGQIGLLLENGSMDCPNADGIIVDPNPERPYYGLNWMKMFLMSSDAGNNSRFNRLLIPGSHDSATNFLTSDLAADKKDDTGAKNISAIPGAGPEIFKNWGRAQRMDVYDQLMAGVRYLDIRVCFEKDGVPYICHGNRGETLQSTMDLVKAFFEVGGTEDEVVIIWFQHVYSYDAKIQPGDVAKLEKILSGTIKELAIPSSASVGESYESLRKKGNILIVMDDYGSNPNGLYNWVHKESKVMCSGWAGTDTDDFASNKARVEAGITKCRGKSASKLFYTPFSITPEVPGRYISEVTGSLIDFAKRTNPVMMNEFECNWKNKNLNIIAIDDLNTDFIEAVVRYQSTGKTGLTCNPNMPGWD